MLLCLAATADGRQRYDPRLRFHTISTPRFEIYYHQGEERIAQRVAQLAERIAADLEPRIGRTRARVHVVLVDQTDASNGWATPLPYNLIEIAAASPRHDSSIGNTNDWLRLVLTHEYTHVVHLERSRGFFGAVGRVFGRNPFFYPNLYTPTWQIEGLATYYESATAHDGRVYAGDFRLWMTRAAAAQRFEALDRASNALVEWPDGHVPYLYGAYFHQYLAEKYGEASLKQLADATAGRLPFFGSRAFKKVFGKPLGELWEDFEASTTGAAKPAASARQLTRHGDFVNDPWFTSSGQLLYSVSNPHEFPALMAWKETGTVKLANRFGGHQVSARGSQIFFDQLEYVRSAGLQSDLYVREANGDVRRLTREARAADPDISPDGTRLVCVVQTPEGRALATVPAAGGVPTILLSEPGVDYASPRWSPEGSRIVAERRALGRESEVVVVNATSTSPRILSRIAASARGRNATPIWSPDGRRIYFASDRDGGPFRLFAFELQGAVLRRLAGVDSAQSPALSPDGGTLVFVGYTPAGYDLFSMPLADAKWEEPDKEAPALSSPAVSAAMPPVAGRGYSPLATLLPRFWTPIVEEDGDDLAFGGATAGGDALARHGYYASAAWSTRGRPDWAAGYAYARWRPTFFADVSDDQEPFREGDIRIREFNAGALVNFRRVRQSQTLAGTFHAASEHLECEACTPAVTEDATRRALRAGWTFDGSRRYGYSISDEEGLSASLSGEWTARALGADGDAGAVVADLRGFLPLGPRHGVLAGRVAGAHAWGDEPVRRVFGAGGSAASGPLLNFDFDAVALLRGFDTADLNGRTSVVANVDYRVPLAWVERGVGTWPAFLRSLHAAVFADGATAWDGARGADDWRASFGAELSADVVIGYSLPFTFTGGFAARYDPSHRSGGPTIFGRIGRAF